MPTAYCQMSLILLRATSFFPSFSQRLCHVPPKSVLVILITTAVTTELKVGDQFEETYFIACNCNTHRSQGQYGLLKL